MASFAKRLVLIGVGCLIMMAFAAANDDKAEGNSKKRSLVEGTWEHFFDNAPNERQVKVVNQTHFIWVTYDQNTGKALRSAGGSYTFDGEIYKEKILFGNGPIPDQIIDREQSFTCLFDKDQWGVFGKLSNGSRIAEKWQRVK